MTSSTLHHLGSLPAFTGCEPLSGKIFSAGGEEIMTYSAMERFNDALKGEPKDHPPILPSVSGWAAANFSDFPLSKIVWEPKRIAEAQIRAREAMGYDCVYPHSDPLYIPEAFGCTVRFPETGPLADPLPLTITCLEDIDRIPLPDPRGEGRIPVILETARELREYSGGDIPVLGVFEGPFTTTCRIIEADWIMRMFFKNPKVLEALLDKVNGFLLEFGHALIENGANILFIPEPTSSASMISPTLFGQFVLPRLQKLTSKLDVPCILHICGDTYPILGAMEQTGAKVLSLDQCMSLSESREIVPKVVLGGNVDPVNSLLMGTREDVVKDTLHSLRTGGGSRYIFMAGCAVPPKTPIENLEIMIKTAIEYGLGPGPTCD